MTTTPSIALIPSGFNTSKVYSVLPENGNADFDFARGSTAIRFSEDKILEESGINVPRLDWYNSTCPNLLIESQSKNIVIYSEDFTVSNWSKTNISVSLNETISPNGIKNADKIKRTSLSSSFIRDDFNKSSSSIIDASLSFFIKKGEGDYGAIRIQGSYPARVDLVYKYSTNEIVSITSNSFIIKSYSVVESGFGFYRASISCLTDNHTGLSVFFSPRSTEGQVDSSDSFAYLWGAQLEENSYTSSYIPNFGTSSGVTRLGDSLFKTNIEQYLDGLEGVIYADIAFNAEKSKNTFNSISLEETAGNSQDLISIFQSNSENEIKVYFRQNNVSIIDVPYLIQATSYNKVALWYKSGQTKLFINGQIASSTDAGNQSVITTTFNNFNLSRIKTVFNNQPDFKLKDFRVYKSGGITDSFLNKLTTI